MEGVWAEGREGGRNEGNRRKEGGKEREEEGKEREETERALYVCKFKLIATIPNDTFNTFTSALLRGTSRYYNYTKTKT